LVKPESKTPPMVFGSQNNNNQANRAKEIQSIYSQKLNQKPTSSQGTRKTILSSTTTKPPSSASLSLKDIPQSHSETFNFISDKNKEDLGPLVF
jgi:hypothetical protein